MPSPTLDELIHRADLDGLIRRIDEDVAAQRWAPLLDLRNRAREAVGTGRQLWPAATLAEYRLALWAPAEWAAQVLDEDSGRFTIGPLTEVVAQRHTFAELAAHLPPGPRLGFIAHERSLRGDLIPAESVANVLELPHAVQSWEPAYPLATYSDQGVAVDEPPLPGDDELTAMAWTPRIPVEDTTVTVAARQLLEPWTASSDGRAEIVCVEGDAPDAVAALGIGRARMAPISASSAMAWLAWAGSSGGAHGRRRGAAVGRFGAWWLVAAIADALDDWPVDPDELGEIAQGLRWYWWDAGEPVGGWSLQLAVADPVEGYAWAISAHDAA